jgi:hypothetical protein
MIVRPLASSTRNSSSRRIERANRSSCARECSTSACRAGAWVGVVLVGGDVLPPAGKLALARADAASGAVFAEGRSITAAGAAFPEGATWTVI